MMPMRHLLFLGILLAVLGSPSAVDAQTGLKRLTLRQDLLGFEAVGRLDLGDYGYCTGVLVATDLVLTAGHCARRLVSGQLALSDLRFRAGLRDGEAVAEARAKAAVIHPGYRPGGPMTAENIRTDVALLQLETAIPAATAAPFRVDRLPGRNRAVSVVSYARDRSEALSWQGECRVLGRDAELFAFNCDVTFGASGAPVFDRSGARPRIVSLISSGRNGVDGTVAFGMELPSILAELKQALRAGRGVITATHSRVTTSGRPATGAKFLRP